MIEETELDARLRAPLPAPPVSDADFTAGVMQRVRMIGKAADGAAALAAVERRRRLDRRLRHAAYAGAAIGALLHASTYPWAGAGGTLLLAGSAPLHGLWAAGAAIALLTWMAVKPTRD
jgi:hypothetical protein